MMPGETGDLAGPNRPLVQHLPLVYMYNTRVVKDLVSRYTKVCPAYRMGMRDFHASSHNNSWRVTETFLEAVIEVIRLHLLTP